VLGVSGRCLTPLGGQLMKEVKWPDASQFCFFILNFVFLGVGWGIGILMAGLG